MPVLKVKKDGMWEYVGAPKSNEIYVQNEAPTGINEGALWVDMDDGGSNSTIPHIGENGNWLIGEIDTGKPSCGKDGTDGKDGYTPVKGVDYFDGKNGQDGEDGYTPQKHVDYWTEADIAEIKSYVDEAILGGVW
jgi:hypothetical protein